MKKSTWIGALAGFYLGFTISLFFNVTYTDWRWWVMVIPTVLLMNWMADAKSKEEN